MNCESVQRLILMLESPDQPSVDARAHLADCLACCVWHEQLLALDREVPLVLVPPPERRAGFLEQLRQMPAPARPSILRPPPVGKRERGLRKMAWAVALAASLLILAVGAWFWNIDHTTPDRTVNAARPTPLESHLAADARWKAAQTPRERLTLLDEMAGEMESKTLALARIQGTPRKDLEEQVRLYSELIHRLTSREALEVAGDLGKDDRHGVLSPIAQRLAQVESEAKRLAMSLPEVAVPLQELALVAADGDRKLRALYV